MSRDARICKQKINTVFARPWGACYYFETRLPIEFME